jgi:hypothetical protein
MKDKMRDSDVDEAHFSIEESHRPLTVHQASIRKPLQKSLQDNISETHIKIPEPNPVFTEVKNPFPNLIYARKNEHLRVAKISDLAVLQEKYAKIVKTILVCLI